jgi:hypothetical protein
MTTRSDLTAEELFALLALPKREFEAAMKAALSHLIKTGAVVDSGFRSEDGAVRWTLAECPPEINRN